MGKHNRKQSFVQALIEEADELEKELDNQETTTAEDEGPEQELDFDRHDFGTITEDEE
jgi:hypothetical protein